MIDAKKLQAMVARNNSAKPFQGGGMEEPEMEEPGMEPEEGAEGGEEEEYIELTPREIEMIAEMVEDGDGDPELMELAEELVAMMEEAEEEGEELENPPAWAASPSIWDKAERAVDPEGKGSKYSEPYAIVVHVYKRMGGKIK